MRKLEVTDPGHADLFNPMFQQLLENDKFLKERTNRSCIINPVDGLKYEIGMDENGVYIVESDENPDTVVMQRTKTLEESDTVSVMVDNSTYGVENADVNKAEENMKNGDILFEFINE